MRLGVHLGEELVGELSVIGDAVEFRLVEAYRRRYPHPVLGQIFEDVLEHVHRSRVALPAFFSNLLPEGSLRELVARQIGGTAQREPFLLAHLGDDLPGAVRVSSLDSAEEADAEWSEPASEEAPDVLKFSLAGVQLKFSALHPDRGMTIPAHGRGGDWIVKLPDRRFRGVPENEWSMMTLARSAGLDVADVELVPVSRVQGLPAQLDFGEGAKALAVKRFDRGPGGARTHRKKYEAANFETLGRLVGRIAPASAEEFVRRLVFHAAIGNGDAHVKNWSLL